MATIESRAFHRYEGFEQPKDKREKVGDALHLAARAFGKTITLNPTGELTVKTTHAALRVLLALVTILLFPLSIIGRILIQASETHKSSYEIYLKSFPDLPLDPPAPPDLPDEAPGNNSTHFHNGFSSIQPINGRLVINCNELTSTKNKLKSPKQIDKKSEVPTKIKDKIKKTTILDIKPEELVAAKKKLTSPKEIDKILSPEEKSSQWVYDTIKAKAPEVEKVEEEYDEDWDVDAPIEIVTETPDEKQSNNNGYIPTNPNLKKFQAEMDQDDKNKIADVLKNRRDRLEPKDE
jgi:hypothetical protein